MHMVGHNTPTDDLVFHLIIIEEGISYNLRCTGVAQVTLTIACIFVFVKKF